MAAWTGWLAALGGLLSIIGAFATAASWLAWLGGIIALIFGIWSAAAK